MRTLHLGAWLALFQVSETEAGKIAGVGQSYIANLISGFKKNPSALILMDISEYLGITVNDLYQRPPSRAEMQPAANLSPRAREAIITLQRRKA